ncbi:imelysin family protein [Aquimarina pacifica]|uniref:imelysin family protein n=1 Tax=Aquimarina pacifica TaxID=1296415 RepID=UPI0004726AF3|nr:imelysin family protein [Aquimarina pacifica]
MNATFKILFVSFFVFVCHIGCKEDDSDTAPQIESTKELQLINMYDNEISVLVDDFVKQTEALQMSILTFQSSTTTTNLESAKTQWKNMQSVWKQLELYDLGTVAASFISFEINRWPTDPTRIEEEILGSDTINEAYVASLGSSSKGIAGIEYLLFSEQQDIASTLELFTTETNAQRRVEYLVSVSKNLTTKSYELDTLWSENREEFIVALENGISGSQNQVINAMIALTEEIIISKLGDPLGDSNDGILDASKFEGFSSEFSKEIIQQHLISLRRCFTGEFTDASNQIGFDDFLLLFNSSELVDKISMQFSICQDQLDNIQGSLEDTLISNPDNVILLKDSFRDLLVLLKVDMANILGAIITFNDNDGD